MVVAVPIRVATPYCDHAVVEEIPVPLLGGFEFFEEVRELFDVEAIDGRDFLHLLGVVAMMGKVMVAFFDSNRWVCLIAAFIGHDEGSDAGRVRLECQHEEVAQQPDVALVILGNALWNIEALRVLGFGMRGCSFDALLEIADGSDVFVEFLAIAQTKLFVERCDILTDKINDAFPLGVAALPLLRGT